jgi:hypothetical protein
MAHDKDEKMAIAYCSNGTVDEIFLDSILSSCMQLISENFPIVGRLKAIGNQISRQREYLLSTWEKEKSVDWLLWVDTDIEFKPKDIKALWDLADKDTKPIVSGVYFISYDMQNSLPSPVPALYINGREDGGAEVVHPLPSDLEEMQVDSAGFGFLLMHRSVIEKLREKCKEVSPFSEINGSNGHFLSEDMSFFKNIKELEIPVYVSLKTRVSHIKRFPLDENYYNVFWKAELAGFFEKEKINNTTLE